MTRYGIIILHLGALLCVPAVASAQADAVPSLQQSLAGSGNRKWVFKRIVKSMGAESMCVSGEFWMFKPDGRLSVHTCVDRRWVEKICSYKLSEEGPIDLVVSVTGPDAPFSGPRRIRITGEGRKLTIRAMSPKQAVAQEDLVFSRAGN